MMRPHDIGVPILEGGCGRQLGEQVGLKMWIGHNIGLQSQISI